MSCVCVEQTTVVEQTSSDDVRVCVTLLHCSTRTDDTVVCATQTQDIVSATQTQDIVSSTQTQDDVHRLCASLLTKLCLCETHKLCGATYT